MFDIQEFQASLESNDGVLKTSKALVRIPPPRVFGGSDFYQTAKFLEFWGEAGKIPGVALALEDIRRYGYGASEKVPFNAVFNENNFSFICDGQAGVWTFFQQWVKLACNYDMQAGINGNTGLLGNNPYELAYKEDIVTDVIVVLFDDAGTPKLSAVMRDAYPVFVGDLDWHWGEQNDVHRIPVAFTFVDWFNALITVDTSQTTPQAPKDVNQTSSDSVAGELKKFSDAFLKGASNGLLGGLGAVINLIHPPTLKK